MRPAIKAAHQRLNGAHARGVELGVAFGDNAVELLAEWPGLELVCVDNFAEAPERCAETGKRLAGRVRFLQWDTVVAASFLANEQFDFVYVDADHTYEGVKRDLNAWYPLVKSGGIFGGHDYANDLCPGVAQAVNEFMRPSELLINVSPQIGDWWVVKP